MKKWIAIINPNAGKGKGEKDWKKISSLMREKDISFEAVFTEKKYHAIELTEKYIKENYWNFIIVGGDGTLNEVVNSVLNQNYVPSVDISIAMIPVGTGNDWCRNYDIPFEYEKAIDVISKGKYFYQDAGLVSFMNGTSLKKRYFINMAGMGFDAAVAKRTNRQKENGKMSTLSYYKNIFSTLFSFKSKETIIEAENFSFKDMAFTYNVGICRFNGGGMKQAPNAIPDDGEFDLTLIRKISRFTVIKNVKKLFDGSFVDLSFVETHRSRKLKINSEPPSLIEIDGESVGSSPFEFEVIPKCLKVIIK